MAIKLKHLNKWSELLEGKALMLRGPGKREITLEVNVEVPTTFMALEHGAEYFLGNVAGKETFIFAAEGEVEVSATPSIDGAQVWYAFDDGDVHAYEHAPDFKLFVKPMTRQQQSPAMRELAEKMQSKADKRMALQAANNAALFAQLQQERDDAAAALAEAKKPVDDTSGAGEQDAGAEGDASAAPDAGTGKGKPKA